MGKLRELSRAGAGFLERGSFSGGFRFLASSLALVHLF